MEMGKYRALANVSTKKGYLVVVLQALGELVGAALDFDHVIQHQMGQDHQRVTPHGRVAVLEKHIEALVPRLKFVGESRRQVAQRHHSRTTLSS